MTAIATGSPVLVVDGPFAGALGWLESEKNGVCMVRTQATPPWPFPRDLYPVLTAHVRSRDEAAERRAQMPEAML